MFLTFYCNYGRSSKEIRTWFGDNPLLCMQVKCTALRLHAFQCTGHNGDITATANDQGIHRERNVCVREFASSLRKE
jgi:hypothetical protein